MLGFPVSRANFDRIAGIHPIESQCRQFILGALFSALQTLQVSFEGQTLGSGSGAQLGFQFGWMLMLMCGHRPLREIVTRQFPLVIVYEPWGHSNLGRSPPTSRLSLTCPFHPRKICHQ
jgi:hypothetical protein